MTQLVVGKIMLFRLLVLHNQSIGDGVPYVYKRVRGEKKILKSVKEEIDSYKTIEKIYAGDTIIKDFKLREGFKNILKDYDVVYAQEISLIMAAHFGPDTYAFAIIGEKNEK